MLQRLLHTLVPQGAASFYATKLSGQDGVECVHVLLCPLDARRHEDLREALLVDVDGVFDDGEVDE
jgi:hypothetical protein